MSTAHPSQSTLSNQRRWVHTRRPSNGQPGSSWQFSRSNLTTREDFGKWAMLFVAVVGLAVSSYLAWVSITSSKLAGCSAGAVFDCGHVMSTKWSAVFGIPVSVPAFFTYFAIAASIGISWFARSAKVKTIAQNVITIAALTAALAAVWFISLQLFVVDHFCSYCLAAHVCSLVLAGLLLWTQPITLPWLMKSSAVASAAIAILATLQFVSPAPKTYEIQTFDTSTNVPVNASPDDVFDAPATDAKVFDAPINDAPVSKPSGTTNSEIENNSNELVESIETSPGNAQTTKTFPYSLNPDLVFAAASILNQNLLSVGLVATIQDNQAATKDEQQSADEKQAAQRRLVSLNGGQIKLDAAHWPVYGNQTAKTIGVEMFDYTCPHCRKTHHALKSAMTRSNDEFAILSLAVPMNSQCNPSVKSTNAGHITACDLANLSVAVWRIDSTKYGEYHDWLFTGDHAPSVAAAKSKAESLVDAERLKKELESGMPQKYVAKQCQLYQSVGQGPIPKIYINNRLISGEVNSAEPLMQLINQR